MPYKSKERFAVKVETKVFTEGEMPAKEVFAGLEGLSTLLLVFAATQNLNWLANFLKTLNEISPGSKIVGASTDEALSLNGLVGNGSVVLTALGFEKTSIRTAFGEGRVDGGELASRVIQDDTKLLIAFSDAATVNGEKFLSQIYEVSTDVIVAGGVAATPTFANTFVIESDRIITSGAVVVSFNSDRLKVHNDYSFGWRPVGRPMKITEADDNRVVSICDTSPMKIFSKYLGKAVVAAMPGLGSAFPLMIKRNSMLIARGIIGVEGESFIVSGSVREGDEVYIGYGDTNNIVSRSDRREAILEAICAPELILDFYCMGRKLFLRRNVVEYEKRLLDSIAPTVGMFTLGEYYGHERFDLLNFSSTVVALSEAESCVKKEIVPITPPEMDKLGLVSEGLFKFIEVRAAELEHLAYFDELTSLPNRVKFAKILESAITHLESDHSMGAILFIDLDNFKNINDTAGHDEGDKVLKIISQRLKRLIDEGMRLCRFGGDEFVIIVKNLKKSIDIDTFADNLLESVKEIVEVGVHSYYLTASIGITLFSRENSDIHELLKQADIAMYRSKKLGKNRWSIYTESMGLEATESYRLQRELRRGIEKRELLLHYQPQYDMESGKIVSLEALVRWNHPQRGLLYPDTFIEIAESSGLIVPFGELVMDMALKFLSECRSVERIAVNISSKQFNDAGFFSMVMRLLKKYGLKPENLELEMTESVVMEDDSETTELLFALAKEGVILSIDDFGTGYSSLSYLKRMPIATLKIDRSFVMDIPSDDSGVAIVKSIVAMAKALDLKLVAEGIETQEQAEFFRREGGVVAQGYFYSKPLPPEEISKLLGT